MHMCKKFLAMPDYLSLRGKVSVIYFLIKVNETTAYRHASHLTIICNVDTAINHGSITAEKFGLHIGKM